MEPKKLFQSILKIDVTYGKNALPSERSRRGQDTHAISESHLPYQEVYLFLKQNQNIEENRLQYTLRQREPFSRFCFCVANRESTNKISGYTEARYKGMGLMSYGAWMCEIVSALQSLQMSTETSSKSRALLQSSLSVFKLFRNK